LTNALGRRSSWFPLIHTRTRATDPMEMQMEMPAAAN